MLVGVEGQRWAIEDRFETAKNELGLDHNETRSWHGWHRHVSLVMLAFAMLAAIRPEPTRRAPKSSLTDDPQEPVADLLVGAGNPPRRLTLGATPDRNRRCHAPGPSGAAPIRPPLNRLT